MSFRVEVWKSERNQEWRFRVKSMGNNEVTMTSESYKRERSAIETIISGFPRYGIVEIADPNRKVSSLRNPWRKIRGKGAPLVVVRVIRPEPPQEVE